MTDPKIPDPDSPIVPGDLRETFEDRVVQELTEFIQRLCRTVPELRTVGIVLDWHGRLNQVALPFLFMDERGPICPGNLPGMIGGLLQTPKLMEYQHELSFKNCAYLAEQLAQLRRQASEAKEADSDRGTTAGHSGSPPGGSKEIGEAAQAGTDDQGPA